MTTLTTGPKIDIFPPDNRTTVRLWEKRRGSGGGFTLLELVLVMLIVCTLLAIAAPSLRGFFASRETKDAAAQIIALTNLAQTQAISQGRVYRLNLDPEEGTYWLTVQEEGVFCDLNNEFGRLFSLPNETIVKLDMEAAPQSVIPNYIEFYPEGRCQTGTIRLIDRRGDVLDIVCSCPTERFHVVVPLENREL